MVGEKYNKDKTHFSKNHCNKSFTMKLKKIVNHWRTDENNKKIRYKIIQNFTKIQLHCG